MSMAISKSLSLFFLILCSLFFSGLSQGGPELPQGVGELPQGVGNITQGVGELPQGVGNITQGVSNLPQGGGDLPCMQNLLPCHPYLKGTSPPPALCCGPMKDLVEKQSQCLCTLFENSVLMKGLNISPDEVLNLAKTCGANADASLCQKGAASAPGAHTASSTSTGSAGSSPSNNTASISHAGRYLTVAAIFMSVIL